MDELSTKNEKSNSFANSPIKVTQVDASPKDIEKEVFDKLKKKNCKTA